MTHQRKVGRRGIRAKKNYEERHDTGWNCNIRNAEARKNHTRAAGEDFFFAISSNRQKGQAFKRRNRLRLRPATPETMTREKHTLAAGIEIIQ